MKKIVCQTCMDDKDREENGCRTCGGYGVLLVIKACEGCGREGWFRPGVFTSYEGKIYYSFDGLKMICHGHQENCFKCEETRKQIT